MATIIAIADAVAAKLNAATFSQSFTAVRDYAPSFDLQEMHDLRVTVVPRGISSASLDRGRDAVSYEIDVAVQQKTDGSQATLDVLMTLVEEIADQLGGSEPLAGFSEARSIDAKNVPVYSQEHLTELRQFTSVLTLTFLVWR